MRVGFFTPEIRISNMPECLHIVRYGATCLWAGIALRRFILRIGGVMKAWVKTYLENKGIDISEKSEAQISSSLLWFFKYVFGIEPEPQLNLSRYEFVTKNFKECFNSVLADLPEEVFDKLQSLKGLFFIFIPGAEEKTIETKRTLNTGGMLRIISFPYEDDCDLDIKRGEIVHELTHVYLENTYGGVKEIELKADAIAIQWGFKKEIKAKKAWIKKVYKKIGK